MKIPTIVGLIERRILVNFTLEAEVAKRMVPAPFTPQLVNGKAIAGICLIRLKEVRPKGLPAFLGVGSENGAHRIAVEWEEDGILKQGVYIPRRDTSSAFNTLVGGRLFPGKHYKARFDVKETMNNFHVAFKSTDGTQISLDAELANTFSADSIFSDLQAASVFFKAGSLGYSPNGERYEGLELTTYNWEVKPLTVSHVHSSFFEDEMIFPKNAVKFDNALLMTNIEHEWSSVPRKQCI
jgi:hypothetical protein